MRNIAISYETGEVIVANIARWRLKRMLAESTAPYVGNKLIFKVIKVKTEVQK